MIKKIITILLLGICFCTMLSACAKSEDMESLYNENTRESIDESIAQYFGNDNITNLGPDQIGD